ncbi:MAG: ABC transporter ATP-binding protein [Gammaproteobacteria bacterium]|nr:ABC transporter ATP-binding protein [Gammaproteobacteria bacterium]
MPPDVKISVQQLRKEFAAFTAVDNVSFDVNKGEVLGFLGPNGAGKSTTMKMITGFMSPTAGKILIDGLDVNDYPIEIKSRIGYLPEGAPAYGDMTTVGFLGFIADIRGYRGKQKTARINTAIEKANLGSVFHKPVETLSKGFKRRVGLAQAILHDPLILIMDEPTDGLDPNQKHEVRELINEMAKDKAILISTHILEEVDAICDRAAIIAQGKIVFDGKPQQLQAMSRTHNAVRIRFAGEAPSVARQRLGAIEQVSEVTFDAEVNSLMVMPVGGVSIVKQVTHLVLDEGWDIEEVFVTSGQLDEVFRNITTRPDLLNDQNKVCVD